VKTTGTTLFSGSGKWYRVVKITSMAHARARVPPASRARYVFTYAHRYMVTTYNAGLVAEAANERML